MRNFSTSPRIQNRKDSEPRRSDAESTLLMWDEIPKDAGRDEERSRWKRKKVLGASALLVAAGVGLELCAPHNSGNPDLEKQRILMNKAYAYFGGGLVLSAIMAWSMLAFRPVAQITKTYPFLVMGVGLLNGIGLKLLSSDSEGTLRKHLKWIALAISPATLIASFYVLDPSVTFRGILFALNYLGGIAYLGTTAKTYYPEFGVPEFCAGFVAFLAASLAGPVLLPPGLRSLSWAELLLFNLLGGGLAGAVDVSGKHIIESNPEKHPIDVAIGIWYEVAEFLSSLPTWVIKITTQ